MARRVVVEVWMTGSDDPCPQCTALDGQEFEQDSGPQPVRDTHPHCQCSRVTVRVEWRDG